MPKTTARRRRRNRSPFAGATRANLRMLRTLATGTERWKRAAIADQFYTFPLAWRLLKNSGGFHQAHVLDAFESRAFKNLKRRDDYARIYDAYDLDNLYNWDRPAYETKMLRREVADLKKRLPGTSLDPAAASVLSRVA